MMMHGLTNLKFSKINCLESVNDAGMKYQPNCTTWSNWLTDHFTDRILPIRLVINF